MLLLLRVAPSLELKVPLVCCRSRPAALQDDEDDRPHNRDEVERQVHEVLDQRRGGELRKGLLYELSQPRHGITAGLDLSASRDQIRGPLGDQHAVKGVDQSILDEERLAQYGEDGGALTQHQQRRRDGSQRSAGESKDRRLRQVCKHEHEGGDADAQSDRGSEFRDQRSPERTVCDEVHDTLSKSVAMVVASA